MQLGARGVSVIIAAGNGGVAGPQSESCSDFVPTFPSSCPFVTSVGSTTNFPEVASSISTGGFSKIFPQPSYQSSAIADYLSSIGSEYAGLFDPSGRGFPDVSTSMMGPLFFFEGELITHSGTGLATCIFSSVIALLNDGLISQGKPVMGFLNPFLYSVAPEVPILNDVTSGSNPGCGTNGFSAKSGWDPVTGLGSPNFPSLHNFFAS